MALIDFNASDRDACIRVNWCKALKGGLPGRQIISGGDLGLYIGWWTAGPDGPKEVLLDIWEKHGTQGF